MRPFPPKGTLRHHIGTKRGELFASLALIGLIVLFALIGLATDGNWPKTMRVALAFTGYASVLSALTLWTNRVSYAWFATAGATAGLISGIVRPQFDVNVLLIGTIGAALLLGTVHWFALRSITRALGYENEYH